MRVIRLRLVIAIALCLFFGLCLARSLAGNGTSLSNTSILRRLLNDDYDEGSPKRHRPVWAFLLIPVFAGAVGYFTNWLAIQMTFYPIEFGPIKIYQFPGQPFGLFGVQGIIPSRAGEMAGILTTLITTKLMDVKSVFNKIDPPTVAKILEPQIKASTVRALDAVLGGSFPMVWSALPPPLKQEAAEAASKDSVVLIRLMMEALRENILSVLDLRHLAVKHAENNKDLVVKMFKEIGANEFEFIITSGLYFGALFGVLQAAQFALWPVWWTLPVAGFLVGWITNYLALLLIFKPLRPTRILGRTWQGLFLRRQREVAAEFARLSKEHFLRGELLWGEIQEGKLRHNFHSLLRSVVDRYCDQVAFGPAGQLAVSAALGREQYDAWRRTVSDIVIQEFPETIRAAYPYMEEAMAIEDTLREALVALPPEEFEGVLHPVFEQDEVKLIMVGGVLGAMVGVLQLVTVFRG